MAVILGYCLPAGVLASDTQGSTQMKNLIHTAVVTLFATSAAQAQQAVQWKVSDGGNGHWYLVSAANLTWDEHQILAVASGAQLVSITSGEENLYVTSLAGPGRVWIGGFAPDGLGCSTSQWAWTTGEAWTYANWAPPEPNYCDETRLELSGAYYRRWNNYYGAGPARSVYEWSADCNGDGIVDYGQIVAGQLADIDNNGIPDICQPPTCHEADLFRNSIVDGADLGVLLSEWGPANANTPSDVNHDGRVDGSDLSFLLANWGPCPQ